MTLDDLPAAAQSASLIEQAAALLQHSHFGVAKAIARRALDAAIDSDDRHLLARACAIGARAMYMLDEDEAAMAAALQAIEHWRAVGDRAGEADSRAVVARILLGIGETNEALAESLAGLEAAETTDDLRARMLGLITVGNVYHELGQFDQALVFCERAAETARLLGDEAAQAAAIDTIGCVYSGLAQVERDAGRRAEADEFEAMGERRSREGMEMARRAGHREYEANALGNLAESITLLGRHDEALALLDAWTFDPSRDTTPMNHHHLQVRARVLRMQGRHEEAVGLLVRVLENAEDKRRVMTYCQQLAAAYEDIGDLRAALDHHKRFHALFVEVNSEAAQRSARVAAVRLQTAQANERASQEHARAQDLLLSNEQLSRRSEILMRQSLEDPLTGLPNRRMMDSLLDTDPLGYGLLLIDVDHFKHVNDDHSHLIGDAVLRDLAMLLRAACRAADTPVRHGGEEFAILLRDLDPTTLTLTAERLRSRVQAHDWPAIAPGLAVTVSIGVASPREANGAQTLIALADRRLYLAKAAGRNRVIAS